MKSKAKEALFFCDNAFNKVNKSTVLADCHEECMCKATLHFVKQMTRNQEIHVDLGKQINDRIYKRTDSTKTRSLWFQQGINIKV